MPSCAACLTWRLSAPGPSEEAPALAIIATGGYGRRELAPFSDVDVTFVPAREDDPYLNVLIKDMFQMVMDVFLYGANLKVGYAYRLLGDLGRLDHQTQTTLLDARFLCGDRALFQEFRAQFRAHLLTADFLFQKWAERQAVLAKHGGDQVYGVEPNIKEGAGGLRDIQNAEWMGEVRCHVSLSRLWPALVEQGFVTDEDAAQIQCRARLSALRPLRPAHRLRRGAGHADAGKAGSGRRPAALPGHARSPRRRSPSCGIISPMPPRRGASPAR